jgi:ribonuclease Y
MVSPVIAAVIAVVAGVVAAAMHFSPGFLPPQNCEAKIGSAEEEAKRLINDAMKAAQQKRKER